MTLFYATPTKCALRLSWHANNGFLNREAWEKNNWPGMLLCMDIDAKENGSMLKHGRSYPVHRSKPVKRLAESRCVSLDGNQPNPDCWNLSSPAFPGERFLGLPLLSHSATAAEVLLLSFKQLYDNHNAFFFCPASKKHLSLEEILRDIIKRCNLTRRYGQR